MRRYLAFLGLGMYMMVRAERQAGDAINKVVDGWDNDFYRYVDEKLKRGEKKEGVVTYSTSCSRGECKASKTGCVDKNCKSNTSEFSQSYGI